MPATAGPRTEPTATDERWLAPQPEFPFPAAGGSRLDGRRPDEGGWHRRCQPPFVPATLGASPVSRTRRRADADVAWGVWGSALRHPHPVHQDLRLVALDGADGALGQT